MSAKTARAETMHNPSMPLPSLLMHQLPVASCQLSVASCQLIYIRMPVAYIRMPVAYIRMSVAYIKTPVVISCQLIDIQMLTTSNWWYYVANGCNWGYFVQYSSDTNSHKICMTNYLRLGDTNLISWLTGPTDPLFYERLIIILY